MGLDMYAFRVSNGSDLPAVDADLSGVTRDEIAYWRKHPNLHGWMEALYIEKGGKDENFNCNTVEVTSADLDALEQVVNGNNLPKKKPRAFPCAKSFPENTMPKPVVFAERVCIAGTGEPVKIRKGAFESWIAETYRKGRAHLGWEINEFGQALGRDLPNVVADASDKRTWEKKIEFAQGLGFGEKFNMGRFLTVEKMPFYDESIEENPLFGLI